MNEQPRPALVFLSYARADRARVAPIAAALQAAGFAVWWDALIEGGTAFAAAIEAQLDSAAAVLVIWSRASAGSDWVRDEAGRGRDLKRLVAATLDGSAPPLGFRQYHATDLSRWKGRADAPELAELVRAVESVSGRPRTVVPRQMGRAAIASRRAMLAGGGGLVVFVVAGGLVAWRSGLFGAAAAPSNSVAVLPFANLSGDPAQAYFSDGLAEEVRSTLSRNALLRVMAPTSARRIGEGGEEAPAIAARLGVSFLLEGSVRRAGGTVRVTAELIDGATGFTRWSDSFDRKLADVFAVESEIAATVSRALIARLAGAAAAPGTPAIGGGPDRAATIAGDDTSGTASVTAYDAYLRGRALYATMSDGASARAALGQFDRAIAADPRYAQAHAARARTLWAIASQFGQASEFAALYGAALEAARTAVALAPDLADAQSTLGYVLFQGRLDIRGALAPYERSYRLGAGDAAILGRYAIYNAAIGRFAVAAAAMERALGIDPLNPAIHRVAGYVAYAARRYDDCIARCRQALLLAPATIDAHAMIGDALFALGRREEARAEYRLEPHALLRLPGLAIVAHALGDEAAAQAAAAQLRRELGTSATYQQAQIAAQWGDAPAAIAALQEARRIGDSGLVYLRNDPMLDPLRSSPAFAQLLSAIGFV